MSGSVNGSGSELLSLPIPGSTEAPGIARHAVLSRLDRRLANESLQDLALVISELVTNSVLHAHLSADDIVLVEIAAGDGRLAIKVTDPGSDITPRLLPPDPTRSHGLGLRVVDGISASWGVRRKPGATQVWCELPLGQPGPEVTHFVARGRAACSRAHAGPDHAAAGWRRGPRRGGR